MVKDPQLYIINSDAIQGQAGKPFSHQPGDNIKFPEQQTVVKNACLCNYRYYQYYAFYQYLPKEDLFSNSIDFYAIQEIDQDPGYQFQTDQNGLFTFNTFKSIGYNWKNHSGPVYLGCHPAGTYKTGQWLSVNLPYTGDGGGQTWPAPSYVYKKAFKQGSLKCMFVTSYKCCNGTRGCGVVVHTSDASQIQYIITPFFAAQYYVTGLLSDSPTAKIIKGTQQWHCPDGGTLTRVYIRHSCDKATVTGCGTWSMTAFQDPQQIARQCQQGYQYARKAAEIDAINDAKRRIAYIPCVWWFLWKLQIPSCQNPCNIQKAEWHQVNWQKQSVPPDVAGKGPGWQPADVHPTQQIVKCQLRTVYQWAFLTKQQYNSSQQELGQLLLTMIPQPLDQNPCKDRCGYNPQLVPGLKDYSTSGSISGAGAGQEPCNSPDPQGKVYFHLDYDFQQFDLYYLNISKAAPLDPTDITTGRDPCKDYYIPQTITENGKKKLNWKLDQLYLKDYQLLQKGRIRGTTFLRWNKDRTRFYLVVPSNQQPPENQSDSRLKDFHFSSDSILLQDPDSNNCKGYYQCYYMGCKCPDPCSDSCSASQKQPYITGGCTKWKFIGKFSQQQLLQRGICLNNWQESTPMRTGVDPTIGEAVYTVQSDDPSFCGNYPPPPQRVLQYIKLTASPTCDETEDDIQIQIEQKALPACGNTPAVYFGWKKQDSLSSSQVLEFDSEYGYIDVSSDSNVCQLYYFKSNYEGLVLYDQTCSPNTDIENPSYDDIFSDAKPFIIWNYPSCLDWVRSYSWNVYKLTPYPDVSNANLVEGPESEHAQLPWSNSTPPTWGWVNSSDPFTAKPLLTSNNHILPRVQGMSSDSTLCVVYYLQEIQTKTGCPEDDNNMIPTQQPQGQPQSQEQIQSPDNDDQDLGIDQEQVQSGISNESAGDPQLALSLITQAIDWDIQWCLPTYLGFKYIYAQFSLTCQTLSNSHMGMQFPVQWHSDSIVFTSSDAFQMHWGWLDSNTPRGNPLLSTGANTVESVLSLNATSDSVLCTVYYVHKTADGRGHSQTLHYISNNTAAPDLSGYTINWWYRDKCTGPYNKAIAYYVAAFQPSCSNSTGAIDPNNISWEKKTLLISSEEAVVQPTGGWYGSEAPTTPQLTYTSNVVQPGDLCKVYNIKIITIGYFCGQPPENWPVNDNIDLSLIGWRVNWNRRKCLNQCNWYVYKQALITPECSDAGGYKNTATQKQSPIARNQCNSNASNAQLSTGYFIKRNNTWIDAPFQNGAIALTASDACQVLYRELVFDGQHCGQPDQNQLQQLSLETIQATTIDWPQACIAGNTYVHVAYKNYEVTCQDPNPTGGDWQFSSYSDSKPYNQTGWYDGVNFDVYKTTDYMGEVNIFGCSARYVYILSKYTACKKSNINNVVPQNISIPTVNWSNNNCTAKHYYYYWQAKQVVPTCNGVIGSGDVQSGLHKISADQDINGPSGGLWYGLPPAGYLTNSTTSLSCPVYDVHIQPISACSQSDAWTSVSPDSFPVSYNDVSFEQSCLISNGYNWYQNYVQFVYSKTCSGIEPTTSYNQVASAGTSAGAVNAVPNANSWRSGTSSCESRMNVPVGTAYFACSWDSDYYPVTSRPADPSFPDTCGKHWYQNYVQFVYNIVNCIQRSSVYNQVVSAETSAGAVSAVPNANIWTSSKSCQRRKNVPVGDAYFACSWDSDYYPNVSDPGTPTIEDVCGGHWYQNYVQFVYSKTCSGIEPTGSYNKSATAETSAGAVSAVPNANSWRSGTSSCQRRKNVPVGDAYFACSWDSDYYPNVSDPGTPTIEAACCDCNGYTSFVKYGPGGESEALTWSPNTIACTASNTYAIYAYVNNNKYAPYGASFSTGFLFYKVVNGHTNGDGFYIDLSPGCTFVIYDLDGITPKYNGGIADKMRIYVTVDRETFYIDFYTMECNQL